MRKAYTLSELIGCLSIIIFVVVLIAVMINWMFHTQWFARHWGGSYTMELPANEKVVTVSWKDSNLWILTRPMKKDEVAETFTLHESSNFGVLQGTVVITEKK